MAPGRISRLAIRSFFTKSPISLLNPPPLSIRHFTTRTLLIRPLLSLPRQSPPIGTRFTVGSRRRHFSDATRAYLWHESAIFAKVLLYGYGSLTVACGLFLLYVESLFPPPVGLPFTARFGLDLSRALVKWTGDQGRAIEVMRSVVSELRESGWGGKSEGWRKGYRTSLKYLAEMEERQGMMDDARAHYLEIMLLPRESEAQGGSWREERVAAALRVSKICEFQKDLPGAEAALIDAVLFARGRGSGTASDGLPPLPDPTSEENTPLLFKVLTELSVFFARHDRQSRALELLTTMLQARRAAVPPPDPGAPSSALEISDPCAESVTMTYLGELLFAMGNRQQGLAWTKEAYRRSEGLAELRGTCKECAIVAGKNVITMLEIMKEAAGAASPGRSGWFWSAAEKANPVEPDEGIEWERSVLKLERIRVTKGR